VHQLPEALAPLGAYRQFFPYRLVPSSTRPGKTDKFPVNPHTGEVWDAHDPAIWVSAEEACRLASAWGPSFGVAFVFTEHDPFFFIDLDDCLTADGTAWSPFAQSVLALFPGAAVEVSQSGKGLHIFGRCVPAPEHGSRNASLHAELYTRLRFVALTGTGAAGNAGTDHTAALHALAAQHFPPGVRVDGGLLDAWTDQPVPQWSGPEGDHELITRALQSRSVGAMFGGAKASFRDLWERNVDVLAQAYPSQGVGSSAPYDESSADAALAQHLCFWTGNNCERIERLMRQSALCREKYDREDYLPRTICGPTGAIHRQREFLQDRRPDPVPPPPPPAAPFESAPVRSTRTSRYVSDGAAVALPQNASEKTYLTPAEQPAIFEGCVYVLDQHRIMIPGGYLVKPEQFKVMFSGYTFVLDDGNTRVTRDPWKLFVESETHRYPKADSATFNPLLPPGQISARAGQTSVNTYWPVEVDCREGDVSRFLAHMELIMPDARDREILLSYMAAVVQFPGVKFQWAPLIQGVEGNGKTLFSRICTEAVGERYSFWPRADKISSDFNFWQVGKILICVEDVYVPERKNEIMEILKPMITGERASVEPKGVDQIMTDICCNYVLNCNDKSAFRKTQNDRRIAPLFTRQQTKEDLERDGLTKDYFRSLYDWLKKEGGYAACTYFLKTYKIQAEYNPAFGQKAPQTSSTAEALDLGRGSVEQEVQEAIDQEVPGFAGGWVSSSALDRLLEQIGVARRIPRNKRRQLLQTLGYVWHPGLEEGRVNNPVAPDGVKCRLFIRKGHPAESITGAAAIAKAYSDAQTAHIPMPGLRAVS